MPVKVHSKPIEIEDEEEAEAEAEIAEGEGEDEEEEAGDEEENEYEVAAIVDHVMKAGKTTYLVAWKGYGEEHNTWEPEAHVNHASDIVKAYWDRLPKKQADPVRKRARPSSGSAASTQPTSSKKTRTTNGRGQTAKRGARSSTNGRAKQEEEEEEEDAQDFDKSHVDSVDKYEDVESWEGLVDTVDTIERGQGSELTVYLTMTGGEKISVSTDVAYSRCPQKLLQFYEAHLKWKMSD